ncbi:hypothetical protein LG634_11960 [Streptomyces bambusae]|uniref:hypothetical protein n=1 Tax=Streptomyces bambusae TaxID=1550616 RepID=UPI001CFD0600|nr:hypothetical protein [Streptomyces bambusae]MCB5165545.1 hypothetical protein [Streptomyces bambusae]
MIRGRGGNRAAVSTSGTEAAAGGHAPAPLGPAGKWLFKAGDGRLTAYAATPEALVRWTEGAAPGDPWSGPEPLDVPGWTGTVAMAQNREGYVHFVALRYPPGGEGEPEPAFATQFQSGRALTDWHGLGAPGVRGGPAGDRIAGPPRIAVNQRSGSVHVLVPLRQGGIVRRSRNSEGAWGSWKQVTPETYGGELAAVMPAGAPLELLAFGPAGIDRWSGAGQGRFALADRIGTPVVPGTPAVCETGRGRATYFWRYPGDGSLVAWRAPHREVQGGLMALGGAGGHGPVGVGRAVIGGYDCTVLAQNGAQGGIELTAYVTENEGYGTWWASLGGQGLRNPQPAVDAAGRLVVGAFDRAGNLALARQDPGQEGLAFGPWRAA